MDEFTYQKNQLYCEQVPIADLAQKYGTPLYVYSRKTILDHFNKIKEAFRQMDPLICYSVKANSNLAILKLLVEAGSGLDIVSGGELERGLRAGAAPDSIVYAGVGKTRDEIELAIKKKILMFNMESEAEAKLINDIAKKLNKVVRVAIRVNPDVDAKTHQYITTGKKENKFGLAIPRVAELFRQSRKFEFLRPVGLHLHIGSQITQSEPFIKAIERIGVFIHELRSARFAIEYLNLGGGLGIIYNEEKPQSAEDFAQAVLPALQPLNCRIILEPGRFIVGNAGILVTQVQYVKPGYEKDFAIVDAGMNDLIRPSLYNAYHQIVRVEGKGSKKTRRTDIVGPICESGDFLGKDREFSMLEPGDLLAVRSTGAYGMVMASNYNSRLRPAEILVHGKEAQVVRRRETMDDLLRLELPKKK